MNFHENSTNQQHKAQLEQALANFHRMAKSYKNNKDENPWNANQFSNQIIHAYATSDKLKSCFHAIKHIDVSEKL